LANKQLRKFLKPAGYYEVAHTPGLWRHISRPIQFTLVVDDFGVKYAGREHAEHLIKTLKKHYEIATDWEGDLCQDMYNASSTSLSTTNQPNHSTVRTRRHQKYTEKGRTIQSQMTPL